MPARFRIPFAVALAALSAAIAAPAADGAWTSPLTVTSDSRSSNVGAAGSARGHEAFVWRVTTKRMVRLRGQTGQVGYVRARMRAPHGRLGKAQTISTTQGIVTGAQIGLDDAGNATAVWTQAGAHLSIMAAYRPHGRRFGTPVEIGRSTHFNDAQPQIAVGAVGDTVIAWNQGRHMQVARRDATKACSPVIRCLRKPLTLRPGSDQVVAIGPHGDAYVVWAAGVRSAGDVHTRLRMIVIRRSGRHFAEHFVSSAADGDASQPTLAVRGDRTAIVAWRASLPAGGEQNDPAPIKAVTSSPDAVAAPVQTVATGFAQLPVVRVTGQGEAILAWSAFDATPGSPEGPLVFAATAPAGGATFGTPVLMSPADHVADHAALAVDAAGTTFLAYGVRPVSSGGPAEPSALSGVRPAGGAFGPAIALPASFAGLSLVAAGSRVTAVSGGIEGRTLLSDWTP